MGKVNEQLNRMSETALRQLLTQQYGLAIAPNVTVESMREQVLKIRDTENQESKKVTADATADEYFFGDEPKVKILFQHKDGDREEKFNYAGSKPMPVDGKGRWKYKIPFFYLIDGQIYDLPLCVMEHLNRIAVPDVHVMPGPDGQITNVPYMRKRFSCETIITPELRKTLRKNIA